MGSTRLVMKHRVVGGNLATVLADRFSRVWIHVKTREITTGNIKADAVPTGKQIRCRVKLDRDLVEFPWRQWVRQRTAVAIT